MPSFDKISYEVTDGRGEIRLDRPDVLNAYDDEMLDELDACLGDAMADDAVETVILTGEGRGFCSGVDLDAAADHAETERTFRAHRGQVDSVYRRLYRGNKPTIAAVNGPAIGAGFGFALCCDLRVMAEDAFMRDQHLDVGLAPTVGAGWLLPRLVGESKAKQIVLRSEEVDADDAAACDLVAAVTEAGETMAAARRIADDLNDKAQTAVGGAIDLMNGSHSFEEYVQSAADWQWRCKNGD